MNRSARTYIISIFAVACIAGGASVLAQQIDQDETVANRARPELDALGVRTGSFMLFPEVSVAGVRNSNIYADDDVNVFSDSILVVSPGLELRSDWGRHRLNIGADADILRYADYDTENRENYSVWADGRFDTARSRFFLGEVSHARLHENRDSPDDARGLEPTRFYRDQIALTYEAPRGPRRFHSQLAVDYQKLDFENSFGANGFINNDDRDRSKMSGRARLGYGIDPNYSIFLQGSAHSIEYVDPIDDGGFERSATGYEVVLGTTLDFPGESYGDVFVGYLSETHDDLRFDKIDGPSFGADVFWNVTGLTTLNIMGRREVQPTTIGETAGTETTTFGIGADHELLRNLILSLDLTSLSDDFKGIERQDDTRSADFSARYILNRKMELTFAYSYRKRDSEPSPNQGIEFSRNLFSLTMKGQL